MSKVPAAGTSLVQDVVALDLGTEWLQWSSVEDLMR